MARVKFNNVELECDINTTVLAMSGHYKRIEKGVDRLYEHFVQRKMFGIYVYADRNLRDMRWNRLRLCPSLVSAIWFCPTSFLWRSFKNNLNLR